MPGTDEMMSLADVYADALVEAAAERGEAEAIADELADLIGYMDSHPEFAAFLTAASVDDDPRRESLERVFRGRMHDLLLNLLQVLNNRGRCPLIRAIGRCVQLRMEAKHQQQEVMVETAMPLSDELKAAIVRDIGERIGKEVLLSERVQPDLIGGAVIRIDDQQIDLSVAAGVRAMQKRLMDRAGEVIRKGHSDVIET